MNVRAAIPADLGPSSPSAPNFAAPASDGPPPRASRRRGRLGGGREWRAGRLWVARAHLRPRLPGAVVRRARATASGRRLGARRGPSRKRGGRRNCSFRPITQTRRCGPCWRGAAMRRAALSTTLILEIRSWCSSADTTARRSRERKIDLPQERPRARGEAAGVGHRRHSGHAPKGADGSGDRGGGEPRRRRHSLHRHLQPAAARHGRDRPTAERPPAFRRVQRRQPDRAGHEF